ncbi:MAG: response regulator [Bryobacteraceae bacterium]|jgi:two-component system OmpR family response regulator
MQHTVLIVDDDPQIRGVITLALEDAGYYVKAVSNGKQALAEMEAIGFDLVVLDLSMPDMDGFEFLKAVRAKSSKPKIVVISGFLGGTLLEAARLFGAVATLAKPFSPGSLLSIVDQLLPKIGPVDPV